MTAFVLATLLAAAPDPASDPDDVAEAVRQGATDLDEDHRAVAADAAMSLADADAESASIAARLRSLQAGRSGTSLWPRVSVTVSLVRGIGPALDRTAGSALHWREDGTRGLVWSILASWGGR